MSNAVTRACSPLQMPPTQKAVLMALADIANNDDGTGCFPSLPKLCEWTCFSRRAVIGAIAWLESAGAIRADRSNGRHTTYQVTPFSYAKPVQQAHRCISSTGAANDATGAADAPDPCISRTTPVQEMHPNHQEPSRTIEATTKKRASKPALDAGAQALLADVDPKVVRDWIAVRKEKRAAVTETAIEDLTREARKLGLTLESALRLCCTQGWSSVKASWPQAQAFAKAQGRGPPGRHSAAADLRGIDYGSTDEQSIPEHLRPRDLDDAAA